MADSKNNLLDSIIAELRWSVKCYPTASGCLKAVYVITVAENPPWLRYTTAIYRHLNLTKGLKWIGSVHWCIGYMLKKWLHKVLPVKKTVGARARKAVLPFAEHRIHVDMLSLGAEKVVKRLHQAGFDAWVVGGAVRDLLLGIEPKDFDVATSATPEQVRKIFRRSRIIGRRFPIVHVMVGPETIEVTTYRGGEANHHNEHGRIMKDVSYGNQEQDAMRRDFTCNALYYDPIRQVVVDYHHGVADVRARRLVMIGNADARYQEDPVRMLRAARLSGKLGFSVVENTAVPIAAAAHLIKREPVARLFDEVMKIIFSGRARACLRQLDLLGLQGKAHPLLDALAPGAAEDASNIIALALANTDERLRADKSVSVGFVLAAVLWPQVLSAWAAYQQQNMRSVAALNAAIADVHAQMEKGWGVPQRFSATMREIWVLQPQFDTRRGARPFKLLHQARFRAAYDFLLLRAELGEVPQTVVQWWQTFQAASEEQRAQMSQAAPAGGDGEPRKRRHRRKAKSSIAGNGAEAS